MKDNKFSVYLAGQIKALEAVMENNDDYFYRRVCRWYSTTFHTPLPSVYKMSLEHIMQQYYEVQLESMSQSELYDCLVRNHLPEIYDKEEEENQNYAEKLEEEQLKTIQKKKAKEDKLVKKEEIPSPEKSRINLKHPLHKPIARKWDEEEGEVEL